MSSYDRLHTLDHVLNFRDFGGYDAGDGARVSRNRLFRSAHFADASEQDLAKLDALGIGFLVDLRRPEERAHEPNRWPGEGVTQHAFDEGAVLGLPPHVMALLQDDLTAQSTARYMRQIYADFPFDQRLVTLYRTWFRELTNEEGAAVIHCAAGKDRTGIGCALTLHALGVGDDAIFADYEFTNQAVDLPARLPRIQARMEERLGRQLDAEVLLPMLGVDVDYLRASFDAIEARHGSLNVYLSDAIGVGEPEKTALRAKFLV